MSESNNTRRDFVQKTALAAVAVPVAAAQSTLAYRMPRPALAALGGAPAVTIPKERLSALAAR